MHIYRCEFSSRIDLVSLKKSRASRLLALRFSEIFQLLGLACVALLALLPLACASSMEDLVGTDAGRDASAQGIGGGSGAHGTGGAGTPVDAGTAGATGTGGARGGSGGTVGGAAGGADGGSTVGGDAGGNHQSAGCGMAVTGTSSYVRQTIMIRGVQREYFIWVPRTYAAGRAYPVIFRWHGSGGNGTSGGLEIEAASREEAIIASPTGIGGVWDLTATGVDVNLFDMLLAQLEARYCVDTARVFSYGFSAGAGMTNLLGCVRGADLRAVAPIEGWATQTTGCEGKVAAWITHSADDTVVTLDRGVASRELFRGFDGCSATSAPISPAPCVRYQGCQTGYPVDWCQTTGPHDPQGGFTGPGAWGFFRSLP